MLIYNMFPRPISIKNVIELTKKVKNVLRNESKNATIHQKKIKLNEKNRLINAIVSRKRCINHSQK